MDLTEALANSILGLCISFALCWAWLGFDPAKSVTVTAVFFVASTARSYLLRRMFKGFEHG